MQDAKLVEDLASMWPENIVRSTHRMAIPKTQLFLKSRICSRRIAWQQFPGGHSHHN